MKRVTSGVFFFFYSIVFNKIINSVSLIEFMLIICYCQACHRGQKCRNRQCLTQINTFNDKMYRCHPHANMPCYLTVFCQILCREKTKCFRPGMLDLLFSFNRSRRYFSFKNILNCVVLVGVIRCNHLVGF